MELTVWLGLLASALFISISPGPGAIFSISQGTQYGFKRAMFSVAGLQLGLVSQILFLLFGLGGSNQPISLGIYSHKNTGHAVFNSIRNFAVA